MHIIPPKSAIALTVSAGETLRIVAVDGGQCSDVVAFAAEDPQERLSQHWTRVNNWKLRVTAGDRLYTNRSRPLLTVVTDTLGVNDFLFPPCNRDVYERMFEGEAQDGCSELLAGVLGPYAITPEMITDPLNVFMNTHIAEDGSISIEPNAARPGELLELRAERDCIVGVTACPDDRSSCNNGHCTRVGVDVV